MPEVSEQTSRLIENYKISQSARTKEGTATIHVDEVASRVSAFYEKIRGVVDWREEHLMRRAAIERVLKRRLILEKEGKSLAGPFVFELIRGGYFPNDQISEYKIQLIEKLIDKYVFILNSVANENHSKILLYDWLMSIVACETEEILDPPRKERALINYMYELMKERIKLRLKSAQEINEEERNNQIYIAVQRSLFKLDNPIIGYHLLKKICPNWINPLPEHLKKIGDNIFSIKKRIENDLKHPLSQKIYQVCEKYDVIYLILGDIISKNSFGIKEKFQDPAVLEEMIRGFYNKRKKELRQKIKRAAFFSTISIFVTKMLLVLAVEIPFDKYITGQFSYHSTFVNILVPPALMFFLVLTARPPKPSNLEMAVIETMKIAYKSEKKDVYEIRYPEKKGFLLSSIIFIFYLATFILSFGIIWRLLEIIGFGLLSKIIFLIFFSLICFAGVKIKEKSEEIIIEEKKDAGFLSFLLDSLSLPFIRTGKWLSNQLARYNIAIVLITILIDMPLQFFIEFLEQWRYFLREKKKEIH